MEKNIYEEYQAELDMLDKFDSDFNNDLITKIVILELQKCKSMENLKVKTTVKTTVKINKQRVRR